MGIYDIDQEPAKTVVSKVQEELYRLEDHADFTVLTKEDDGINFKFDGGIVEFALPEGYEYWSEPLMQQLVIMRLLYVDKKRRGKGIGTEILKKVLEAYEESPAAIVIYPILYQPPLTVPVVKLLFAAPLGQPLHFVEA